MRPLSMNDILWDLTPEDYAIVSPRLAFATPDEGVVLAMMATDQLDMQTMVDREQAHAGVAANVRARIRNVQAAPELEATRYVY